MRKRVNGPGLSSCFPAEAGYGRKGVGRLGDGKRYLGDSQVFVFQCEDGYIIWINTFNAIYKFDIHFQVSCKLFLI